MTGFTSFVTESTGTRMINDTMTNNKAGTSFSIENKVPSSDIGNSEVSLLDFLLYEVGYLSDIAKCYLKIPCDDKTSRLCLMYWYDKQEKKEGLRVFRRCTMDFGDSIASLVIRIIQKKFLILKASVPATKHCIDKGGYAENYSTSFQDVEQYKLVKDDTERIHAAIGLLLKATFTDIKTDPEILKTLGNEKDEEPSYSFLSIKWNLVDNTIKPLSYFNLGKKMRRVSAEKPLNMLNDADFLEPSFLSGISRRILLRVCAQAYDRLGAMLAPIIAGLKILVSRSTDSLAIKNWTNQQNKMINPLLKHVPSLCRTYPR